MDKEYLKGKYTIDKFLARFEQKPDLENLRKELKLYGNELHTAMTDILKTETEAIVNLAEHLTNLHSKVLELSSPVFQLHEEIKSLYTVIIEAEQSLQTYLEEEKAANKSRDTLTLQNNMKSTALYIDNIIEQRLNSNTNDLAVLERAVNEFSFQSHYLDEMYSEQNNHKLNVLYEEALKFLNTDVKNLVDLVNSNSGLKGFNFIVNSFWKVTDKLLQENLPYITAPGNPELFQKRFQDTWQFLFMITSKVNPSLIYEASFQDHMKRFNLPVYFEIRFQQISASFETDIIEHSQETIPDHPFLRLKISAAFWRSINHCFHSEVFLAHLTDQFIKLSLLLLSRFLFYIDTLIENKRKPPSESFIINLMIDMESLKKSLGLQKINDIPNSIYKIVPRNLWSFIGQIIKINEVKLDETHKKLKNYLIDHKVGESVALLQQIFDIPRLYRRTNKFAPTTESNYIRDVVTPLKIFSSSHQQALKCNLNNIMDSCVCEIGKQYTGLVREVLQSVCRTEESLRRLKSRNVSSTDDSSSNPKGDLSSDEAKIREQIKLDVKYFVNHTSPFVSTPGRSVLDSLIKESGCTV
ncbi:hypothetical protein Trydic_g10688 [Trypoxylus dichotomus]